MTDPAPTTTTTTTTTTTPPPPRRQPKLPPPGIWCPAITFFNRTTDTLDLAAQSLYFRHLSLTGLAGLVILGTNAEPFLLTRAERTALIRCARAAVGPHFPLMVGCGAHSTAQAVQLAADAAEAGGDYVLVLPPGYFGKAAAGGGVVRAFYAEVARRAAVPVVLYNFPGVCGGVDLDSEVIRDVVLESDRYARALAEREGRQLPEGEPAGNVVGVKLTCGSVGKMTRLTAYFGPRCAGRFAVFAGQADFLLGGLAVGGAGCIAAFANVFPKTLSRIYKLYTEGEVEEALRLHRLAAVAEAPCKLGVAAVKYAAAVHAARAAGVEGAEALAVPRRPYEGLGEEAKGRLREAMREVAAIEEGL